MEFTHLFAFYNYGVCAFVRWKRPSKPCRLSWKPSRPATPCSRTNLSRSACSSPSGRSPSRHRLSACESTTQDHKAAVMPDLYYFCSSGEHIPGPTLIMLSFPSAFSPLPHGQRADTDEVCLFTRDEPKMTAEQTQRFYKRLLEEKGVKNVTEVSENLRL